MKAKKKKRIILTVAVVLILLWPVQALAATLRIGSSGQEVVKLQQALRQQGYFTYHSNTGYYGTITQDAVLRLQRDWGLMVDGIAGPQTQNALYGAPVVSAHRSILKYGMSGSDVAELQSKLKTLGFFYGNIGGNYLTLTQSAVITFQKARGLYADGIAGPATQNALNTAMNSRGTSLDRDSMYWLARIVYAEAGSEPYDGQVAVANVILNRVRSSNFPNTVYGVIFEYYKGIPQFSPVEDGTIYNTPSKTAVQAAQDAVNGYAPVGSALYFFNPAKAAGSWIRNTRTYIKTIGGHAFYR